jgi:phosphoglycolate phosphatase
MTYQTIFFDLDGTLSDPKPGITGSIQYALAQMGRPAPDGDDLVWCIGPSLRVSFKTLLETEDATLAEQALSHYRRRFSDDGWMFKNTLYAGIPDLLRKLKNDGWRLFVVTAKPQVYAEQIVGYFGLKGYFDAIYGPDLNGYLAHKSDLLSHVVVVENLDTSHAIMIGDRRHDIEAARHCGVYAIGVTYGYGSREELLAANCDELIDDVAGLYSRVSDLR